MKILLSFLLASCLMAPCVAQESMENSTAEVVVASDLDWQQLNPKRGDASPKAANVWGDRNGTTATGFLVRFVDGFSSPPHIHNVTYRAVVISGLVHNDDPEAKEMWMPVGSFWTQPAGEVHITSASGRETTAYVEIDKGPYLVLPTKQAFDRGERPVNVDASNVVWLDASDTTWITQSKTPLANGPKLSHLWGKPLDNELNGSFIKLPANFAGQITANSSLRAVIISGQVKHQLTDDKTQKTLTPGSYFGSTGQVLHHVKTESECIIYVRSVGKYQMATSD